MAFTTNSIRPRPRAIKEKGAVLAICLILLLLVTVLGLSTIGTTTMQEQMAANTRDKDLAFQAAELALKVAEQTLEVGTSDTLNFTPACTDGLCSAWAPEAEFLRWKDPNACGQGEDIWSCNKSRVVEITDAGNHAQPPRFFIEELADLTTDDNLNIGNIGDFAYGEEVTVYRITAIGYGGSTVAQAVLQTTYAK